MIGYAVISVLVAAGLVAVDQLIKIWATANLQPVGTMPLIPHVVELHYVLNQGAAFSMLSGHQTFLIVFTTIALVAILIALFRCRLSLLARCAWTLVLAGGVGNLIDRVLHQQVVDYFNLLFMNFAVFNFADICVTVGVCLLILDVLLDSIRSGKHADKTKTVNAEKDSADGNA